MSGEGHENAKYPIGQQCTGFQNSYYNNNSANITDVSFVKVRNISLGYTFNNIPKVGISQLRVYLNVTDPFVFTKYPGWDPQFSVATNDGNGPATINYQLGVNVKF